ncbi:MAG TPA: isoleucine--tRNA ligase [Gaiellaceae bacterium]|nr:isoleucine--tRNA ligase [Gaiellaceae bacterium]
MPFRPLPSVPDHPALEREILAWWDAASVFDRLREQTAEGDPWSFVDGPITANGSMGVHHGWGRTLKDVFQRYKALRGFRQRYQNGFDCQGLWVEVSVERELGLNSKREIEDYGLAEFAERCKESVARHSATITEQSRRLGMWMDWENSYFTFSDTNIEYIWRFLKRVHERGWLYQGHRSNVWCPRCGTSISQHELIGSYEDRSDPSLYVRFPLLDRDGESLVVWTTTPWTLPANVAAAVAPDATYVLLEDGAWVAEARLSEIPLLDKRIVRTVPGAELVGLRYEGPFDGLEAAGDVEHRVIPWDDVTLEEGTGVVHIAPGCGAEDFELARVHDLPVLTPVDEAGRFYDDYGWLHGLSTVEAADQIVGELGERGRLVAAGEIVHRYPVCWRCHTPLIFRIVDEWFISADEIRPEMLAANATVEWTPDFYGKRMDDWLRNMGDWNISRKRFFGLPLPLYPCECGHLNVIGSRAELEERAVRGLDQLQELHRPWVDAVPVSCEECGREVARIPEVGDAWLDAGIVPFSTLGWRNEEAKPGGYASGASEGLSGADLPDHAYWETWFPADWISEMREQIRLWFYSQLFMSVALEGRAPYRQVLAYEKLRDETGREMHKSWGNAIDAAEAMERMGADVMRFLYCDHVPQQNLNFGYGPANEVKRELLTFWNSVSFLVMYANVERWSPRAELLEEGPPGPLEPLDRWILARTQEFVAEAAGGFERFWTPTVTEAFRAFTDDLSDWYVRRTRPRFWRGDPVALETLWYALVQAVRVIGPVMPFLAEHLWRNLVAEACEGAPASVFLAGWPRPRAELADEELLTEVAEVRRVVGLGHSARQQAERKLRQPLRRMVVEGAEAAPGHADEIAAELRVKEVEFGPVEGTYLRVKPNLPVLGPRLGKELAIVRAELGEGRFEELDGGRFRVAGHELGPDEVFVERVAPEGWAIAAEDGLAVAVDVRLDPELELEGRVLDTIHAIQRLRKDAGLELTDRIVVTLPEDGDLLRHEDWIKSETLATRIETGPELAIAKASEPA